MMNNSGNAFNLKGDPIRADSYYNMTDGLHTVQLSYNNLVGGIGIQATLSLGDIVNGKAIIPEEDWFWINLSDLRGNGSPYPYVVYPKDPLHPTGDQLHSMAPTGDTGTEAYTFVGNFTYLRAVLTRDYITPVPMPQFDGFYYLGQVNKVLVSV